MESKACDQVWFVHMQQLQTEQQKLINLLKTQQSKLQRLLQIQRDHAKCTLRALMIDASRQSRLLLSFQAHVRVRRHLVRRPDREAPRRLQVGAVGVLDRLPHLGGQQLLDRDRLVHLSVRNHLLSAYDGVALFQTTSTYCLASAAIWSR